MINQACQKRDKNEKEKKKKRREAVDSVTSMFKLPDHGQPDKIQDAIENL
jgi:hypothetical protein